MQNMGEVFKELRKSRNISLQEAMGGEFTYSMLSKFERGEADLSSMKLITALDNIHSDLNEFMYLVRGFSQKKALAFQENLWDLYDREGIDSLHSLYEETTKKYRSSAKKTLSRQSLLTHDRKRSLAYNEDEQYQSVVFNRAFPSLLKKLDEQES